MAVLVAALLASLPAAAGSAQMRGVCMPHEAMVDQLKQRFGEQQVGIGAGPSGSAVFELFVAETGTWTLLVTRTNGISCIATSGEDWKIKPLLAGEGT